MRKRACTLGAFLFTIVISAWAVTPQFWENFTQEELLEGTLTRVSLAWDGRLSLARSYSLFYDTGEPFIFSMVRDSSGNFYLGTGHSGKVYKVDPQGNGSLFYQAKELDIFALALDSTDTLYIGTSPEGKVYKASGPMQATEFCDPEDKYIWSLLFDGSGNLYVATGGRGVIHKVDRSGQKTTFFNPPDTNITCLALAPDGQILAGTSPGGLALRIDPKGKAFTLLDTPMEEVRALTVDRFGTIYAVATGSTSQGSEAKGAATSASSLSRGAISLQTVQVLPALGGGQAADAGASVSVPGGGADAKGSRSSIYAISREGSAETIYTSDDKVIYDVIAGPDNTILASSGDKGRLLSIDAAKKITVMTDSPEEQITQLVGDGYTFWAAGSNQGRVYRLDSRLADDGSYVSEPLDAKVVSGWGKISWSYPESSGASVAISTRSGNTEKPDNTWSDWSAPYKPGQQATSPPARYLQWRANFKRGEGSDAGSGSGFLERMRIPYLQQNLRPQVVSITVLPSGIALEKPPALTSSTISLNGSSTSRNGLSLNSPRVRGKDTQPLSPRRMVRPGAQSFTWNATDENDDSLEYSIYFKGGAESDWKLLEEEITDTFYSMDSISLPDGIYTIKVVASDAPSNAYGKFLIGELVSKPFAVSNTTPTLEITGHKIVGRKVELQFVARIPTGRIESAEFSIDGGNWFLLFPTDGIADTTEENYEFVTPDLAVGEHLIGLRASDINGNTGTAKLVAKIP